MKHYHLKKLITLIGINLFYCNHAFSNNVALTSVQLTGQNTSLNYTNVQFNISWDNSWRLSSGVSNWDACWLFIKFRKQGQTTWNHATLNYVDGTAANDGNTEPANSTINTGSDGKGAFIYRSAAMAQGTVSYTGVKLRWNYGTDGLLTADLVEVAVFAIEMVYVPQGNFYLGSGGAETGHFYTYPTTTTTYQVTSENAITIGTTAGNLYYASGANTTGDAAGPIPAAFPKGYAAFYCMKYEASQDQYVAFLNKLTYTQQAARTAAAPSSAAGTVALVSGNRNGVQIKTPGVSSTTPAVYACNLNANGVYNEAADGQSIPCNQLEWEDIIAYLDWAALRPMTEMEYEKACRGTAAAVANEYPWGSTSNTSATGVTNSGAVNEVATNVSTSTSATAGVTGPLREGSFAGAATTRATSGATYYGIMDMGGNLWEYIITAGHSTGRAFTAVNGNGAITAAGIADATTWPATATGTGFRGGNWNWTVTAMRVSDRSYSANAQAGRYLSFGIRGVRR